MDSWRIFESFEPESKSVFLDVVHCSATSPARPRLKTKALTEFENFRECHAFLSTYTPILKRGEENPILQVCCGKYQKPGCDVGPCFLGVTRDYRCEYRDRFNTGYLK
jgi:hypothetical protein